MKVVEEALQELLGLDSTSSSRAVQVAANLVSPSNLKGTMSKDFFSAFSPNLGP